MSLVASDPLISTRHHAARAFPHLADWLDALALRELAQRSRDDYERTIAKLLNDYPDTEVGDFTASQLERFLLSYPAPGRGTRRSHVSIWFKWLARRRRIAVNPMDELEPVRRGKRQKVIEVFSDAECEILCGLPGMDGPLCTILLYTGIRKSEARRLIRSHVVLDPVDDEGRIQSGHLVVYAGKGNKDRVVPFEARVAAAVRELDIPPLMPNDHLWPMRPGAGTVLRRDRPIGDSTMQSWWANKERGVLAKAGVVYRNLHVTRHTFATRLIRAGARIENVQKLMGHTSIQTTVDLYGHLDVEDARADLRLLEAGIS